MPFYSSDTPHQAHTHTHSIAHGLWLASTSMQAGNTQSKRQIGRWNNEKKKKNEQKNQNQMKTLNYLWAMHCTMSAYKHCCLPIFDWLKYRWRSFGSVGHKTNNKYMYILFVYGFAFGRTVGGRHRQTGRGMCLLLRLNVLCSVQCALRYAGIGKLTWKSVWLCVDIKY